MPGPRAARAARAGAGGEPAGRGRAQGGTGSVVRAAHAGGQESGRLVRQAGAHRQGEGACGSARSASEPGCSYRAGSPGACILQAHRDTAYAEQYAPLQPRVRAANPDAAARAGANVRADTQQTCRSLASRELFAISARELAGGLPWPAQLLETIKKDLAAAAGPQNTPYIYLLVQARDPPPPPGCTLTPAAGQRRKS